VDLSKLTTADKLILGGGIAFLISMFLPWWGIDTQFGDAANNGWDYFLGGWLPLLLIVVMCVQVIISRFSPDTTLPDPPVPWAQVHLIAGAAAAAIVLLRLIIPSDECAAGFCIDLDREVGLFIALLAALAVAAGGFLKQKDPDAPVVGDGTGSAPF